jgi:aconitate hydratase
MPDELFGLAANPVYLKDIWPTNAEIQDVMAKTITPEMFKSRYADIMNGGPEWQALEASGGITFDWDLDSDYMRQPPHFSTTERQPEPVSDIKGARPLVMVGDMTTTDHISPVGTIDVGGAAGQYLIANGVAQKDFNSFAARRTNHDVMVRGTFANIRIRNEMAPGTEGGFTRHMPSGEQMTIFDASSQYQADGVPLVVIGGSEYGTGSSRDWAAKGTKLLGVKAIIAEGLERIHRSNLIGMGVLPLQFKAGTTRKTLKLDGSESFDITGLESGITPRMDVTCRITRADGTSEEIPLTCRLDTAVEVEYYENGGMLHYILRQSLGEAA